MSDFGYFETGLNQNLITAHSSTRTVQGMRSCLKQWLSLVKLEVNLGIVSLITPTKRFFVWTMSTKNSQIKFRKRKTPTLFQFS